jgi:cytochrome c oxidase subunit II
MEKKERNWLFFLIAIFLIVNIITLSTMVPWQEWLLWNDVEPDTTVHIQYEDYEIILPQTPVTLTVGEYVEFIATSSDVTYGFGVFRQDNSLVFQMQVLPGRENHIIWRFDEPGPYDVRSTEYSGPRHSDMHIPAALWLTE